MIPIDKWDIRFLELAEHIAQWSKDPSTKVGAVAVDSERRILATGYNGFPRGVEDLPERYEERELKYELIVHAELNVCLQATRSGVSLLGAKLYVTMAPCPTCAGAIVQSGIAEVYYPHTELHSPWDKKAQLANEVIFREGRVFSRALDLDLDP